MTATGSPVTIPLAYIYQGGFSAQPVTTKFAQSNLQLLIYDARSITMTFDRLQPTKIQFLLQTDPDSWGWINKGGPIPTDVKQLTYNKVTDLPGPSPSPPNTTAARATDPKTKATISATRVVAVGASKFLENDVAESVGAKFFTTTVDWLVKKNAVLDISPKKPQEYGISLNPISYRTVAWCAAFFVPGAAFARHFHLALAPEITRRPVMFRYSSTHIYLAIALGPGVLRPVLIVDKKIPGTKEQEDAETQLFRLNPDLVTSLEITNDHGFFFFQKVNNHLGIREIRSRAARRRCGGGRRDQSNRLRPAATGHPG